MPSPAPQPLFEATRHESRSPLRLLEQVLHLLPSTVDSGKVTTERRKIPSLKPMGRH